MHFELIARLPYLSSDSFHEEHNKPREQKYEEEKKKEGEMPITCSWGCNSSLFSSITTETPRSGHQAA